MIDPYVILANLFQVVAIYIIIFFIVAMPLIMILVMFVIPCIFSYDFNK